METSFIGALGTDTRVLGDRLGPTILQIAGSETIKLPAQVRAAEKPLRVCPSFDEARCLEECP